MSVDFKPGQFYGVPQFGARGAGFDIRMLAASCGEEEVHVHTHHDAHFVLVLFGAYISSARGAPDCARSPTLIFNPPGTTHRDRFTNGLGTFVTVSVTDATFEDLRRTLPLSTEATRLGSNDALTAAFLVAREVRGALDATVMESSVWELLAVAGDCACRSSNPPGWVAHAYEAIMDRATDAGLGVGDVAADVGVHPVHLARVFREAWGCSPGELLRWRRVDRAADLLRRTGMPAAHIAAATGFVDQSHLTRAFRAVYGVAPGTYRRKHVSPIQAHVHGSRLA